MLKRIVWRLYGGMTGNRKQPSGYVYAAKSFEEKEQKIDNTTNIKENHDIFTNILPFVLLDPCIFEIFGEFFL